MLRKTRFNLTEKAAFNLPNNKKGKNPDFWIKKIERNRNRDYENDKKLLFLGYTVLHFWGQDISKHTDECLQAIEEAIWDTKFSDTTTDYDISEE
ncbi:DUF559 domain-containing protein [Mediterraneibacter gnavus]|uniref:DUF559 domain-containing protein n=1 Tax=Mediterraneibacter gnavus TaxID=33038 RepID=UPI0036D27D4C